MTRRADTASPDHSAGLDDLMSVILLVVFAVVMSSFLMLAVPLMWLCSLALDRGQRVLAALSASGFPAMPGVNR